MRDTSVTTPPLFDALATSRTVTVHVPVADSFRKWTDVKVRGLPNEKTVETTVVENVVLRVLVVPAGDEMRMSRSPLNGWVIPM